MFGFPRYALVTLVAQALLVLHLSAQQQDPRNHVVEASASADGSSIELRWRGASDASAYVIYRRSRLDEGWSEVARLGGNATSWRDSAVASGTAYEYRLEKPTAGRYAGIGFLFAGNDVPATHSRGKIILVIDSRFEGGLTAELERFRNDLAGDGWIVRQLQVNSSDSPASVRDRIRGIYDQDRANTKAVFLIGHVPVPYSGDIYPDGHENHRGAWPADVFYGEMDGSWTDHQVHSILAEREVNRNRPGDGKFDQSYIPGPVKMAIGRLDFFDMTCFANKTPARSELDLLRAYFAKNHEFRHGRIQVNRKGFILDNFAMRGTNAISANGWRNFSGFFGWENVSQLGLDTYFPTLENDSALATWGAGGGSYYYSSGIGTSDDFALRNVRTVFTLWLGSYYGDWNNESNFLRAALGSGNILISMYSGFPHSFLHRMSLGETIGEGLLLTQNNREGDGHVPDEQGVGEVHISLLGDPTLRLHPVKPPSNLQASAGASGIRLTWTGSVDTSLQGYHIYRKPAGTENFTRVTSSPVNATSFDDSAPAGEFIYMVRAVKREQSGTGTYFNLSQGISVAASSTGQVQTPPKPPASLSATVQGHSSIILSWTDASSDETRFRIERRVAAQSQFQEIGTVNANISTFTDSTVSPATTYIYRVRAENSSGTSAYSNEAQAQTGQPPEPSATVVDLGSDSTAGGDWISKFGSIAYAIAGGSSSFPPAISFQVARGTAHIWQDVTTDPRALRKSPSDSSRMASAWYDDSSVQFELSSTEATDFALYFLDWDRQNRIQDVAIIDKQSNVTLLQKQIENFGNGTYMRFRLEGTAVVRTTPVAGPNAVVAGLFAGGAAQVPSGPPALSAARGSSTLVIRLSSQGETTIQIQSSTDLRNWSKVLEHQVTPPLTEVPVPTSLNNEYFRAMIVN